MSKEISSPREVKNIDYCFVDGKGDEQVKHVSDERGGQIGYAIDEHSARIWLSGENGEETSVYPLSRIVFIREVISYITEG